MMTASSFKRPNIEAATDQNDPPAKRCRGANEFMRPFETFRDIRRDAISKAGYQVDDGWPFEEERAPSDRLLVPAFVFTHSFHFTRSSATQAIPYVTHEMLWRCSGDEVGDCKAAAIKLCHELGKGTECDAPVTNALEYSINTITEWSKRAGSVRATDRPVRLQIAVPHHHQLMRDTVIWDVLQPFNTAQQYASGVCEGLGLRFDWYKSIVNIVEELLTDIVEEFRREGSICLPCVPVDVVGVRHGNDAEMAGQPADVDPCRLSLLVSNDGFIHVAINTKPHADSCIPNSNECASPQSHDGMGVDSVAQDTHPLLSLPGVKAAQDSWTGAKTYHLPAVVQYNVYQDTMIAWRKRMETVRQRWKEQDVKAQKKVEAEVAQKQAEEAQRVAEELKKAGERAKMEAQQKAKLDTQRQADQEAAQQRARAAQQAGGTQQAAAQKVGVGPQGAQHHAAHQQAAQQQAAQQHAAQQHVAQQQAAQQHVAQQQAAQQHVAQQQAAQQRAAQLHAAQQHAAQQHATQEHAVQHAAVQRSGSQPQAAQQLAVKQQPSQPHVQHLQQQHAGTQPQAVAQQAAARKQVVTQHHSGAGSQVASHGATPVQQPGVALSAASHRPAQHVNQAAAIPVTRPTTSSPTQQIPAGQHTSVQARAAQPGSHRMNMGQQPQPPHPAAAPMPNPLQRRPLHSAPHSQPRPAQNQQTVRPPGPGSASPGPGRPQSQLLGAQPPAQHQHSPSAHTVATPRPLVRPLGTRPSGAVLNSARPAGSMHTGAALHSSQSSPRAAARRPDGGQQQWHAFLKSRIQQHSGHAAGAEAPGTSAGRHSAAHAHPGLQQWSAASGPGQRSGTNTGTSPVQQAQYASSHGQQAQQTQSPQAQQQYQQPPLQQTQSPQQYHQSPPQMQQQHSQHQQNQRQQGQQHLAQQQHAQLYRKNEHQ